MKFGFIGLVILSIMAISTTSTLGCTYPVYPGDIVENIQATTDPNQYSVTTRSKSGGTNKYLLNMEKQKLESSHSIELKQDSNSYINPYQYQVTYANQTALINGELYDNGTWKATDTSGNIIFSYSPVKLKIDSDQRHSSLYSQALNTSFLFYGGLLPSVNVVSYSFQTNEFHSFIWSDLEYSTLNLYTTSDSEVTNFWFDESQVIMAQGECCVCIRYQLFRYNESNITALAAMHNYETSIFDNSRHRLITIHIVDSEGNYKVGDLNLDTLNWNYWSFKLEDGNNNTPLIFNYPMFLSSLLAIIIFRKMKISL